MHGEVDTEDSHGVLLPHAPPPAPGAPTTPRVPSPALANWRASPWMIRLPSLSKNRQEACLAGHCPGQGRRVCVSRKENKVDQ